MNNAPASTPAPDGIAPLGAGFTEALVAALPTATEPQMTWGGLTGAAQSLAAVVTASRIDGPLVVVCPDARRTEIMIDEVNFFSSLPGGATAIDLLAFPDREALLYDRIAPRQEVTSSRLSCLKRLRSNYHGILVVAAQALTERLPPLSYIDGRSFSLAVNQRLDITQLRERLDRSAYSAVRQVVAPGEFAVRGGIVDIFPTGSEAPLRIDLFDDEIESIRIFDAQSQLTIDKVSGIEMLPATEYPFDEEAIKFFRQSFRSRFAGDPQQQHVYREVSRGHAPPGLENFLPLFFDETVGLLEYIPANATLFVVDDIEAALDDCARDATERHEHAAIDAEYRVLEPNELTVPADQILVAMKEFDQINVPSGPAAAKAHAVLPVATAPVVNVDMRAEHPYGELIDRLVAGDARKLVVAESLGRRDALQSVLADGGLDMDSVEDFGEFVLGDSFVALTHAPIERGLALTDPALEVYSEAQFYGPRKSRKRRVSEKSRDPESIIRDLAELEDGAPVVHEIHGVGRYRGLAVIDSLGRDTEFLTIEYLNGDLLYVPVMAMQLVGRYIGGHPESAPLHRLGTDTWAKARKKAREKAYDVAAELLELEALRAARVGQAYDIPMDHYAAFAASFDYDETPDQESAITDVLADMASERPMDRLVCGDVGFGKTEVAIRASYIAVLAGKQVAVLVPTTLLAQQHYDNFTERFAGHAVDVELLSRFRTKKATTDIVERLDSGKPDILIGTHRLLQKDIKFTNLGLLILDEEHRFGVRQKERLKKLRAEVDILTLTATPIPRTLNFAMSGLRQISVIATPPPDRRAIKTFVREQSDALVREAITRELRRGGQVYVVHNRVQSIEQRYEELTTLVPEANIRVGHGQMTDSELAQVMTDFYHRRFDVLLCTTIIESGIDIPTANTMVIDRADRFGLAQLHQLRGRVGRSNLQAYAYLLTPGRRAMTSDAIKRLDAIASLEELGAGFALASQDLEIRGAGELLGEAQSGSIDQVGFTLYTDFLNRAIDSLRKALDDAPDEPIDAKRLLAEERNAERQSAEMNLHLPALFPSDYIPDVHVRLVMYKRIASADSDESLRELQIETIDRFGLIPDAGKALFQLSAMKLIAEAVGIVSVDVGVSGGRVEFRHDPPIGPEVIIGLLQSDPGRYAMNSPTTLVLKGDFEDPDARIVAVGALLDQLHAGLPS